MGQFKFYEVDKLYVNFLQKHESKIPNISYTNNDKFICGILFSVNDIDYYSPISSFNKQQKTNILIKNNSGEAISSVRLSFMFPVPKEMLAVKDFSKEDYKYKRLLIEELNYCNKNAHQIIRKAEYVYNSVCTKADTMMVKNCCDFKLLEEKCIEYCKMHNLEIPITDNTKTLKYTNKEINELISELRSGNKESSGKSR